MPQLPSTPCLLRELFRIRPGQFGEFLDSNPTAVLEPALIDKIGGLCAAFRDYEVRTEVIGCSFEVLKGELREGWNSCGCYLVWSAGKWWVANRWVWDGAVIVGVELLQLMMIFFWVFLR